MGFRKKMPDIESMLRNSREYDKMINQANEKLDKIVTFQEAIFNCTGPRKLRDQLAELVGQLVSEERSIRSNIDEWIKLQDEDSKA